MTATTMFDIAVLKRAIEERNATAQLALYADDAEVQLVDRDNPPASPRVLLGKDEIRAWIEGTCARDMTHRVERHVVSGDRAAFTQACRYPDGTNVLCLAMLELSNDQIVRQTGIQAWDT